MEGMEIENIGGDWGETNEGRDGATVHVDTYYEAEICCKRHLIYRDVDDISGETINLETQNQRFLDWLVDKRGFKIRREMSESGIVVDYGIEVMGCCV